jgi:formylglycine-generating enzyme required for sulfatase activity/dienelactone hydrolase
VERQLEEIRSLTTGPASGVNLQILLRQSVRPLVAIPFLLMLVVLAGLFALWWHRHARVEWAINEALPRIARLNDDDKTEEAYALAAQAERYIPDNPQLKGLWKQISWTGSIITHPAGASVYRKDYANPAAPWELVGTTPIANLRSAAVDHRWKFVRSGFVTAELADFVNGSAAGDLIEATLTKEPDDGMVLIELGGEANSPALVSLGGFEEGLDRFKPIPLEDFRIDKYEVTNRQYKQFLDHGGYREPRFWKYPFLKNGRPLPWEEALALFKDSTGRPGPAKWVAGEYPPGQDYYPVTGVSWFEAAAYAEFAGKQLPTIYHWSVAAAARDGESIIPLSNFSGQRLARVGEYQGMSWSGTYDMAGNAKEWVLNEGKPGLRYILGGSWNDPTYMFNDPEARSPFDREANFGFRCARYAANQIATRAAQPIVPEGRDFIKEKPVSDQIFAAYKSLYSYDKTPLHATIEATEQTEDFTRQRISIDAAYGHERMAIYLYLPKKARPPFQTIAMFPAALALRDHTVNNLDSYEFPFILKTGRAIVLPIYKGTFDRADGLSNAHPDMTNAYRDHVIEWSKDLGRSLDYLETRPDIDSTRFAYVGFSWGAAVGAILPALEDRFKAIVLRSGGFYQAKTLPEVDQLNFPPHIKVPVLMLNGRYDFYFPTLCCQQPMFRLMGSQPGQKRSVLYDSGHDLPDPPIVKETLDWLDHYLGPVNQQTLNSH